MDASASEQTEQPAQSSRLSRRRTLIVVIVMLLLGAGAAALGLALTRGGDSASAAESPAEGVAGIAVGSRISAEPQANAVATPDKELQEKRVTITATGDITLGTTPILPPGGASALLAGVASALKGNIVLGNLETALSTGSGSKCGSGSSNCFAFQAPPSYAKGLRSAGFTVMNLANNHSLDFGQAGLQQTINSLRRQKIRHTGRPGQIKIIKAGGLRVAILGFAPYPWAQNLLDISGAKRLVRKADREADLVVVTFHGGAEGVSAARVSPGPETFLGEPRGNPVAFSHAVVDAGADVVFGHGPHVLRGMEWYKGRLIAYSLGNFSSYKNFNLAGLKAVSGVLRVTLRGDGTWVKGRFVPLLLVGDGAPVIDSQKLALGKVRSLSKQDFGKRAMRISAKGVVRPPHGAS